MGKGVNNFLDLFKKVNILCLLSFLVLVFLCFGDRVSAAVVMPDLGTITVTGIDSGDTLEAYQIILPQIITTSTTEIEYKFSSNFINFCASSDVCKETLYDEEGNLDIEKYFQLTSGDITSGSTQTTSTLDKLMSSYAIYIKNNGLSGQKMTNSGDTATLTDMTGSYLILPTKTNRIYAVMVANIDYKAVDGKWIVNNPIIVAKVDDPYVKSWIGEIGKQEASFNVGEEYTYYVEAKMPSYPTNMDSAFTLIYSFLGNGVTFSGYDTVTITQNEKTYKVLEDSGFIVDSESGESVGFFTFYDSDNRIEISSGYLSDDVLITFKGKLNENSNVCRNRSISLDAPLSLPKLLANEMVSAIQYVLPYDAATTLIDKFSEKTLAHTYRMKVRKYDLDNDVTKLSGAVFDVYSNSSLTNKVGTITTTGEEYIELSGLGEGIYYLVETKAPTGYSLLKEPVSVEIKYKEDELDEEDNYCGPVFEIGDSKVKSLPFTGGMGTILYTTIGFILIVLAGFGVVYYRKMNKDSL